MYATGQHTDRTLTAWLNVNEQRTARDRAFGVDTVREMLCNAAYAGYVSGRRDRSKAPSGACTSRSWTRPCTTGCSSCAASAPAR